MKKLILSVLVVSSLLATSCKKAKEAGNAVTNGATNLVEEGAKKVEEGATKVSDKAGEMANKTADVVKSAAGLAGVEIPEFKDPKVTEYLTEYVAFAKEYIAEGANVASNADLMKKSTDLATKSQEVMKALGTDTEAIQKFTTTLSAIASKMAPAVGQ